jgi:hypothetical protein
MVRASSRLARFEQAMSRTKPESPMSSGRMMPPLLPTAVECRDTARQELPACSAGCARARRSPKPATKAAAAAGGHARARAAEELEVGRLAVAGELRGEGEGPEEVDAAEVPPVVERGGQHADDLVPFAVDAEAAADDVGRRGVAVAPGALG